MAVLVGAETKVLCQGFTGAQGTFHSEQAIAYGTQMVGGVTPGKGGTEHLDLPVFDTVTAAMAATALGLPLLFLPSGTGGFGIRPLFCFRQGRIEDSGERRRNQISGTSATVWRIRKDGQQLLPLTA